MFKSPKYMSMKRLILTALLSVIVTGLVAQITKKVRLPNGLGVEMTRESLVYNNDSIVVRLTYENLHDDFGKQFSGDFLFYEVKGDGVYRHIKRASDSALYGYLVKKNDSTLVYHLRNDIRVTKKLEEGEEPGMPMRGIVMYLMMDGPEELDNDYWPSF